MTNCIKTSYSFKGKQLNMKLLLLLILLKFCDSQRETMNMGISPMQPKKATTTKQSVVETTTTTVPPTKAATNKPVTTIETVLSTAPGASPGGCRKNSIENPSISS
jgi:hypothetical protein